MPMSDAQQAWRYNSIANNFNNRVTNFGHQLSGFRSSVPNLSIANPSGISSARSGLSSLLDQADNPFSFSLSWEESVPQQSTSNHTWHLPGGPYQVPQTTTTYRNEPRSESFNFGSGILGGFGYSRPNVSGITSTPNTTLASQYVSDINSLLGQLGSLEQQRQAEIQRVNQSRSMFEGNAQGLLASARGLNISDLSSMNALDAQLAALDAQRRGFSSALRGELFPDQFGGVAGYINQARSAIGGLRSQRAGEDNRINNFRNSMLGLIDNARHAAGNASIANLSGVDSIDKLLDQKALEAQRFQSALNPSFANELSQYSTVDQQIDQLRRNRQLEQERIAFTRDDLAGIGRDVGTRVGETDIYSGHILNDLRRQIESARARRSGFSSVLPFDFSDADAALEAAGGALEGRFGERQTALSGIRDRARELGAGIGDIPLHDEALMRERLTALDQADDALNPFTGGSDLEPIRNEFRTANESVDARLKELQTRRDEIEARAKELMTKVRGTPYYNFDQVTRGETDSGALQDEVELYDAQQALDELDAILGHLGGERSRLQGDESARTAAAQRARDEFLNQRFSRDEFAGIELGMTPVSDREYMDWLSQLERGLGNSPFSRGLGVIRV